MMCDVSRLKFSGMRRVVIVAVLTNLNQWAMNQRFQENHSVLPRDRMDLHGVRGANGRHLMSVVRWLDKPIWESGRIQLASHGRIHFMNAIILTGQLICQGDDEIALVKEFLPLHLELTRAEPGCISFEVAPSGDPNIWDVSECFQDGESFLHHQMRVKASEWGHATADIERNYSISGLTS